MAESKVSEKSVIFQGGAGVEPTTARTAIMAAKTACNWWALQGVLPLHHITPRTSVCPLKWSILAGGIRIAVKIEVPILDAQN